MTKKHLTQEERITISNGLNQNLSFEEIASRTGKSATTISRELRNHMEFKRTGPSGAPAMPVS